MTSRIEGPGPPAFFAGPFGVRGAFQLCRATVAYSHELRMLLRVQDLDHQRKRTRDGFGYCKSNNGGQCLSEFL